jgi:hypothetical protein
MASIEHIGSIGIVFADKFPRTSSIGDGDRESKLAVAVAAAVVVGHLGY